MAVPYRGLRRKSVFDVDIDILCPIVGKYSIPLRRYRIVPQRCFCPKRAYDMDIDILCPIVGKYLIPLRRYRIVPQRCFCPKRAYDVGIDILSPATQDCAPGALLCIGTQQALPITEYWR